MQNSSIQRRIAMSTGIVMASVFLSRVLGFFREWTVAHQIGSNATTDAYYAAFTLPDFLNYLVAGGSLSVTFIPVFAKYVAEEREDEGWRVFSIVVTFMGIVVAALVIAAEFFAPQLVTLIAPGFGPAERAQVIYLTRLMLPAQFFFYVGGILSAVQYAKQQFIIPSLAPLIYNIGIIAGGLLLSARMGITGFAVGVVAGALAGNLMLQAWGAARSGARFEPSMALGHPGFRLFVKLAIPIMLALSLSFSDDWIIRWFGSYLVPASITWLSYAKTLMRVPLGIVGQGIGVASFPILAQLYSEKKFTELNDTLNGTLRGMLVLLVPLAALTMAVSLPLVHLVFARTRMHETDLAATAATLELFSLGLVAWGLQYLLARGFYATHDTITPAVVGTIFTVANLPIYWLFVRRAQHLGLALASSIGITIYALVLFILLIRRTNNHEAPALGIFFLKISAASAAGALACHGLIDWMGARIPWSRPGGAFVDLAMASTVGCVVIAAIARLLGIREVDEYLRRMRQLIRRETTVDTN